jgi:hypothetical protein
VARDHRTSLQLPKAAQANVSEEAGHDDEQDDDVTEDFKGIGDTAELIDASEHVGSVARRRYC